jgi:1-deoxy-D-xylulose-5-phosphate synthase
VSGEPISKSGESFSGVFGKTMISLAEQNNQVCAITAAMPTGTGLTEFKKQFPKRMFDVGIAEEHAVSMAGGLAKQGMVPVVALYSTFLQRAYDMVLQDICMQKLHVVFAVDRAGLVGEDGETHHGVFDIGFLQQAPGMHIICPGSLSELQHMLTYAVCDHDGPIAIRYPRGGNRGYSDSAWESAKNGVACHKEGKDVVFITYGTLLQNVMDAAEKLEVCGVSACVLRLLTVKPLPLDEILSQISGHSHVIVAEEALRGSGIGQHLAYEIAKQRPDCRVDVLDLGEEFITHGSLDSLYRHCSLDGDSICNYVQEVLKVEN